jgi:hypothetical protein
MTRRPPPDVGRPTRLGIAGDEGANDTMTDGCVMDGMGAMMGFMRAGMLVVALVLVGIGSGAGYTVAKRR